jgi:hypothetical protein
VSPGSCISLGLSYREALSDTLANVYVSPALPVNYNKKFWEELIRLLSLHESFI